PALHRVDGVRRAVVIALAAAALLAATSSGEAPAAEPAAAPVAAVAAVAAATPAAIEPAVASDVISVYTARQLDDAVANAAITAARRAGGVGLELNAGVLALLAVRRGGTPLQRAAPGFRWPFSMVVMPPEAAGHVVNRQVARILALGQVVMAQTTA